MIVTLIAKERSFTTSLPNKIGGQYWVTDLDDKGNTRKVISVEGVHGTWFLHSNDFFVLQDKSGLEIETAEMTGGTQVILGKYRKSGERVQLFIEPSTEDRRHYQRYCVTRNCRFNIGRDESNQIVFSNQYVSAQHACLIWQDGTWSITDTQSSNGTFVNEWRVAMRQLDFGDTISILGLKIVVGRGFFAINSPDGTVSVSGARPLQPQSKKEDSGYECRPETRLFFRSPRFCRELTTFRMAVDPPPNPERIDDTPLLLVLGPALTMGLTAVIMAVIAIINYNSGRSDILATIPTMAMSFTMLCGTLLWPVLTRRNDNKRRKDAEKNRQKKYREYLDEIRNEIFLHVKEQEEILLASHPDPDSCEARVQEVRQDLWERVNGQQDFLRLRLGLGDLPLLAEIDWPKKRFAPASDNLSHELYRLADEPKVLHNVPITISLCDMPVVGIIGPRTATAQFLQNLVLQITALHSYDEVKLAFFANESVQKDWKYARWYPHCWNEEENTRFFASDEAEAKALASSLEQVLSERMESRQMQTEQATPQYVLIVPSVELAEKTELFSHILHAPKVCGFSCIVMADGLNKLPKECSVVVDLKEGDCELYDLTNTSGVKQVFHPDEMTRLHVAQDSAKLANIRLDVRNEQYTLPNMLTFLEMYHVSKVEHLNALTRWKESDPVNSLQVPVGLGCNGELFLLDLHQRFQGPHGLVAGMTGSGKSEFIITLILSLSLNFSPEEVAFILIDYKGGGLAGAFEDPQNGIKLPHLAGTITNLDGAAVKRSLISIQSELRRRERIFADAKVIAGTGTVDIYKYQQMYRDGLVSEPLPHLLIVSDEFAELKAQEPEFMEQLISAARIGRSLGVHLILATQKPSGVVNDQIWSNSRFHVCLKVQDRTDSMDMIKRPDAAAIAETGRFFLQVGFNEFFAMGQSAWCGAPYLPAERVTRTKDERVSVMDNLGRVLTEAKPKSPKKDKSAVSQVVAVVKYLSRLAGEENSQARQLWLPPLPENIHFSSLEDKYQWKPDLEELETILGEYDDPFNQSQGLMTFCPTRDGNTILYGVAGSGKVEALHTILYGLFAHYDAAKLNTYVIDMAEETLTVFADAPQAGGVLTAGDREKIYNLMRMLEEEVKYRKQMLAETGVSYQAYAAQTGKTMPHILVVLHNYTAFTEQFEDLDETIYRLTREGSKYGLFFLMTANSANSVRYRISQNFSVILPLQFNDKTDYVALLGSAGGVYPTKAKGRGLFKRGEQVYEFQLAWLDEKVNQEALRKFSKELAIHAGSMARPVPALPDHVLPSAFPGGFTAEELPVGVETESLHDSRVNLAGCVIYPVLGQECGETALFAQGLAQQLARMDSVDVLVLDSGQELEAGTEDGYKCYQQDFEKHIVDLFEELVRRNNVFWTAKKAGQPTPIFQAYYCLILGLGTVRDDLSDDGKEKLTLLLQNADLSYGMHFLLFDGAKNLSLFSSDAWYKLHVDVRNGIWIGSGIRDQYVLKNGHIPREPDEFPESVGYVVKKGRSVMVKFLEPEDKQEGRGRL